MPDKKEEYEYLFLDIEWNQTPGSIGIDGREAIQIGVVAANSSLEKVKSFSKGIRLSDVKLLNEETVRVSHTTAANIMQGRTSERVLSNLMETFPVYNHIVVWTRDTYDLLKRDMKKCAIPMKKHRVIVLQDVISVILGRGNNKIGFEKALRFAQIEYASNYLHYAKHDANYLYQLFSKCYQQYSVATEGENCVLNLGTGKLHTNDCRYVKHMAEDKKVLQPKSVVFEGFTVCKVCGNREEWKYKEKQAVQSTEEEDLSQLPLTEQNIEKICNHFQVSYSMGNDFVSIRTAFAGWIVCLREGKVTKLFHENYRLGKSFYNKRNIKFGEGYHKQKIFSNNFYEVVRYIQMHDAGFVTRMLKKSRTEKLFDKVEMELHL